MRLDSNLGAPKGSIGVFLMSFCGLTMCAWTPGRTPPRKLGLGSLGLYIVVARGLAPLTVWERWCLRTGERPSPD